MADIRIPSADVEICGRGYHIEMNMNVLADLQEQNDGNMLDFLRGNRTYKTGMMIAAALLNEAADIAGTGEHFDAKTLGRQMNTAKALKLVDTCINLLYDALRDEDAEDGEENAENNEKKLTNHAKQEPPKGINFAWYLNIWINVLHNDEKIFWRTMTPHRCMALYNEYFKMQKPRHAVGLPQSGTPKKTGLLDYISGGG